MYDWYDAQRGRCTCRELVVFTVLADSVKFTVLYGLFLLICGSTLEVRSI